MAKYSFAELTNGGKEPPAKFSFAELTRTEGADVTRRLKTDLDFEPTPEEAKSGYDTPFQLPDIGSMYRGAKSLVTEQLPSLVKKGAAQADQGSLAERVAALPATAGEALLQGTMGLGQMILPPIRKGVDELAAELQDPANMAKRLRAQLLRSWLSPELRDKVAPEVPRSPQQEAAAVGAWVDRVKEAGAENRDLAPILEGDKTFLPGANPGYSALAGNFLDPTMLIPAAGAAKLTAKAGKLATKTATEVAAETASKGGIARSAAGAAAPTIEKAAAVTGDVAESVGKGVDKLQPVLDVAGLIQGGLPGAAGAHVVGRAARAATKWASKVGDAGTGIRNVAKADWNSTWTVAKQLAKDSDAPAWLRRSASSSVAPLVETSIRTGSTAAKGATEGAVIGAAAAGVNDTLTPEERDEAIGAGAALGTGGALAGKAAGEMSGRNALVRQSHDIAVRAHKAITEGANPASVLSASDATMFYADNVEKLFKGAMPGGKDLSVRLMDNSQFQSTAGPDGTSEVARFVSTPDGKFEVHINLDVPGADARLLHEAVGHGLIESVVGNNPDALARARAVFTPELIPVAENQYADAILPTGTPEEKAAYVAKQRANSATKYGAEDVWILSELLSESAVQSTAGKSLHDIANPGFFPTMERSLGRENKFEVSKSTFFKDEIADALASPDLTEISTGRLADLGKFRPGIDLPAEGGVKVKPTDWGKVPHAPLEDLGGGRKGNDFVEANPTTGTVVPRTPMQVRKRQKNRRDVVNQEIPASGDPAPVESGADDLVRLRRTISGLVERSGTRLGQWFFDSPVFSDTHKAFAQTLSAAMRAGDALSGWYHQIGEGPDWKESVGKDKGNITAQFKDFVPINFAVSKAGNLLVRNYSLTAFDRKAQLWGSRQGPASLELWNGDIGQFRTDVQTYLNNHSNNRPGSEGVGEQKRDVINAFLVGGNRAFESVNPLRASMKGADRQGIVRAYRLDRLETLEPSEVTGFTRPSYEKQVRNLSPKAEGVEERLPKVGETVGGLRVRSEIPNQGSIEASLESFKILPGVREVLISEFQDNKKPKYFSASEEARTRKLAESIAASKEISPLIVVYDGHPDGPYVLEGGHRFDALRELGVESFPALVVLDNETSSSTTKSGDVQLSPRVATGDKAYLKAVENKDLDTAKRMVEMAAKKAGYGPDEVIHGTTHMFTVFNTDRANIENDFGKGYYFSNTSDDVAANYAGVGPDLTQRIELLAERLESTDELSPSEARAEAEKRLKGAADGRVIKAFVKLENPAKLGGKDETRLTTDIPERPDDADFESTDYYEGSGPEFLKALEQAANEFGGADGAQARANVEDHFGLLDGTSLREVIDHLRKDDAIVYADTDEGDNAHTELIRRALEIAGYDGIIDRTVNKKFGSERKAGRQMQGMDPSTYHVIAFRPEQIKSSDPVTYDDAGKVIPLSKRFDQSNQDIRYSPSTEGTQPMKTSAVKVLYGDSDVLPPPPTKKKRNLKEVAGMIQQVAMDQWDGEMVTSSTITPDQEKVIVDNAVDEVKAALSASGKNAYDWYTTAVKRAVEVLGVIHPELVSDEKAKATGSFPSAEAARTGMMTAMAISSQNLTVNLNSRYALEQFEILSRTGKFDVERADEGYGTKSASIASNFRLANTMIEQGGWESLTKFLKQDFTVGELSKAISEVKGRKVKIAGRMGDIVQGAAIFGPKIGQGFLQNLFGNFTPVTVDLWMRRTWGRWTGDVVGDGVTPERLARLVDGARAKGIALPKEIITMRTVTRKGENGSPYKTVSEAVSEALETDESIRDIVTRYSIELAADWDKRYKTLRFQPVTPEELANLRSGGLNLEDLSDSQLRLKERLNTQYSKLAKKPKKADWIADRLKRGGYTEFLTKDDINPRKPEWAGAAVSIKNELGPVDIPSDQDRAVITRIVNKVRAILESEGKTVTNADLQAILWYPEKDLWEKLMSGKPESRLKQSYDDEFLKIANSRGLGEAAHRAIAAFESRTKPTDRTSRDGDGADTASDGSTGQKTDKTEK